MPYSIKLNHFAFNKQSSNLSSISAQVFGILSSLYPLPFLQQSAYSYKQTIMLYPIKLNSTTVPFTNRAPTDHPSQLQRRVLGMLPSCLPHMQKRVGRFSNCFSKCSRRPQTSFLQLYLSLLTLAFQTFRLLKICQTQLHLVGSFACKIAEKSKDKVKYLEIGQALEKIFCLSIMN